MAVKIVQNVNKLSPTASASVQSNPISLKTGYIRVSTANTGAYVAIGTDPTATVNSFHVPPFNVEVLKERIARQQIAGITTGTTTVISFKENADNPFIVGDYVTIQYAAPVGINSTHSAVTAVTDSTVTIQFNSTSYANIEVSGSTLSRSVKVAALGQSAGTEVSICEVVQLVSE